MRRTLASLISIVTAIVRVLHLRGVRLYNCLKNANIQAIGDLVQKSESEMLCTKNFGRKSLNETTEILSGLGLNFGMKFDSQDVWPWIRTRCTVRIR